MSYQCENLGSDLFFCCFCLGDGSELLTRTTKGLDENEDSKYCEHGHHDEQNLQKS